MTPEHLRKEFKSSLGRVRDGFIIAFIAMVVSIPQIYHQVDFLYQRFMGKAPDPETRIQFFLAQLIFMLSALLIIILVGDLANRRAGLQPFAWPGFRRVLPQLGLGILFIPAIYFLSDRLSLALLPELYPDKLGFALLYPFSVSFPDELFVRYGFLGLAAWILGKVKGGKFLANLFIAAVFTLLTWFDLAGKTEAGFQVTETAFFMTGLFIEHLIAGAFYLKHGFWSGMAFRLGTDLKYLLYYFLFF